MGNENSSSYESDADQRYEEYELKNPIKVSFDLGALEEGNLHVQIYNSLVKEEPILQTPPLVVETKCIDATGNVSRLVDISDAVRTNSFMAFSKKDADSLILPGETLDAVGDFPYLCDETEVDSFDQLFRFVAARDFQLVAIDNDELAILSIFVIRPKVTEEN